ncbi:MAG: hypothetical protein ABSG07_22170 [Terriglobales bacterium]
MTKQEWVCEGCGLSGSTEYKSSDGAFAVVHAIRDHHERLASQYAPTCHFDIDQTRVLNPELMDQYAWNRFVAEISRKTARKRA